MLTNKLGNERPARSEPTTERALIRRVIEDPERLAHGVLSQLAEFSRILRLKVDFRVVRLVDRRLGALEVSA